MGVTVLLEIAWNILVSEDQALSPEGNRQFTFEVLCATQVGLS
jgi:hypothetical protein